jgi:hypothetical protein
MATPLDGETKVTDPDEPQSPDPPFVDDEEEGPALVPSVSGAVGQMLAALLVVVGLVVAFVGMAAALRRILP